MPQLTNPITEDGDYTINVPRTADTFVEFSGGFGGGTVTLKVGKAQNPVDGFDGIAAPLEQKKVYMPKGTCTVTLAGSTGAALVADIKFDGM